jgi:hypothetical protein
MRHHLEGAPDPFPSITDAPVKARKETSQPLDVASESAFPSLGGATKPAASGWSAAAGPRIKAAATHPMHVESFTLQVVDLSTAGKDGKPTTLGQIMQQVMVKHPKVKIEASSNQRTHQTTFNVKSESQKELEKAKRMLLASLSPVVSLYSFDRGNTMVLITHRSLSSSMLRFLLSRLSSVPRVCPPTISIRIIT